jgi:hypothetical protein
VLIINVDMFPLGVKLVKCRIKVFEGENSVMLVTGTLLFVEMTLDALARNFGLACTFFPLFWLENYFAVECLHYRYWGLL